MFIRKNQPLHFLTLILLTILGLSCTTLKQIRTASNPAAHVNPFIGTAPLLDTDIIGYTPPKGWRVWAGLVFPGSSLPNALVQLSPMTKYGSGAGYEYEDTEILSFTHTNKGHWNLCHIPVLPVSEGATAPFKSRFSHDNENASPAFYEVLLDDYRVNVRLSSTLRAGIHEYTYQNPADKRILFDLGKANNRVSDWQLRQNGNAVEGFQRTGGEKVHFYALLDQEIESVDITQPGKREGSVMIRLKSGGNKIVVMKIGISFVSVENARENLMEEIGARTIDDIRKSGHQTWNQLLSQVEVDGGTARQKELFYTSLYRSFLWPALRSDYNGQFQDEAGSIRKEAFNYYEIPSLWDTYRNKDILLSLLSPKVSNDVIKSMIDRGEITGFMPTFFHGDHGAPYIAGTYFRNIGDFDIKKAYKILLNNAYNVKGPRAHLGEYIEKGFISDPDIERPHVESKGRAGVSKTLEYSYDDYSLSLLAEALGDQAHAKDLKGRSANYKNMFDKSTNFMRGRLENGDWITPFNPQYPYYEYMYREGSAWHLSFFAPHDMPGLVALYGSAESFEAKLDSLFSLPRDGNYVARNISGFMGQYSHGNQPAHEAPFSYYFIDKPWKSQTIIDHLLENYYGIGEHGLTLSGMDDAGEMSSWYVMSALGMYTFSPADPEYLLTVPIFDEIRWSIEGKNTFTVKKPGKGRKLRNLYLNGTPIQGYFLSHEDFINGGTLLYETE